VTAKKPAFPPLIVNPRSVAFAPMSGRGVLPHLHKEGCSYFVTFCLADVAPFRAAQRAELSRDRGVHETAKRSEPMLKSGACILRDPALAAIVEDVLLHDQDRSYALSAWCIMPNHVHVVVTPFDGSTLVKILQAWKSVSAHRINRAIGRKGAVWQRESFDHVIRNADYFDGFVTYTERNPVAAGLVDNPHDWAFSSARWREQD
jgi:REP element-mobilizing transposase RayT